MDTLPTTQPVKAALGWVAVFAWFGILVYTWYDFPRFVPGGPFVSVRFTIIPIWASAWGIVWAGLIYYRHRTAPLDEPVRIICIVVVCVLLYVIAERVMDVVHFYIRPSARGRWLAW